MPDRLGDFGVVAGGAEAFLLAFAIAAFDCYSNVRATLQRATIPLYRVAIAYLVWVSCGIAALGAYIFSIHASPDNWVNQALSLGTSNDIARGLAIGTSVLVLIRSRVLTAGGSDIGGEYFYNLGRVAILRSVTRRRARDRDNFLRDAIDRIMTIPEFETRLVEFVNNYMEGDPEAVRKTLADQFHQVQASRPAGDCAPAEARWQRYYRGLAGVAVDYCGVAEISHWVRANAR